jgi:GT2 family glycosyltransferase
VDIEQSKSAVFQSPKNHKSSNQKTLKVAMKTPLVSVITPVFNPVLSELRDCLKSAKSDYVEHILCLDGVANATSLRRLKRLAKRYGARLETSEDQLGISVASNRAASVAQGEFLVFLDQDDFFVKNWARPLFEVMGDHDFVYSDSFIADVHGKPLNRVIKPSWSPVRLIFNMYAVHFMAVRKTLFESIGGFRPEFDGSQDHDLALRISRATQRITHIELPLYHWRQSQASTASNPGNKTWAFDAGLAAAEEHLRSLAPGATLEKVEDSPGALRAKFTGRQKPVSVVIPTAYKSDASGSSYVDVLAKSLLPFLRPELGDEIVLVHGGESESEFVSSSEFKDKLKVVSVHDDAEFNFSRRCNIGFEVSENEHVLLLNDDIEFGDQNPFDSLFGLLSLPNVGIVGALLAFPDYTIQHGGHAFTAGNPHHAHYEASSLREGLMDLVIDHEVVGVTGALMFQLKATWKAVGGFTSKLPLNYNDVDYCQKVRTLGFSIIQANSVNAIHHESVTRDSRIEDWELATIRQRWPEILKVDEFSTTQSHTLL